MYENMNNAIINVETHFIKKDGHIYAESLMDSMFWKKYLNVFSKLYVIVRMKEYEGEDLKKWVIADYKNVVFLPIPDYRGPKGYLQKYFEICRMLKKYSKEYKKGTVAVIRSPSPLGYQFLKYWKKNRKPYGLEICSNLSDEYYYSIDMVHSILYRRLHEQTKRYVRKADGVAYVTKSVLQKQYPSNGIQTNYSSVDLPKELFYKRCRLDTKKQEYTLIHVSTLALDVKGNEEFFRVQKNLLNKGYPVKSVVVGGGRLQEHYIRRSKELGLAEYTRFTGHISEKEDLLKELRAADIFLFPTLSEGLPRTVIEAMACSLPCVSSDIPSLRELMERKWLCGPHDIEGFTRRIIRLIDDVNLYNMTAERNYNKAQEYEYSVLNERRSRFYSELCRRGNGNRVLQQQERKKLRTIPARALRYFLNHSSIAKSIPDRVYLNMVYFLTFGVRPNLKNPVLFNEKMQWLKLHDRNSKYTVAADKFRMKEFVNKTIGEGHVFPVIGVYNHFDEIDFNKLPNSFVLKTNHDSGSVVICKDKHKFDKNKARKKITRSLKRDYFFVGREWPYKNIRKCIFAEKYMVDAESNDLVDFKLFVFNGKAEYVQIDYDRFIDHHRNFYDLNWNYIPFTTCYPTDSNHKCKRPKKLDEMVKYAEKIASELDTPPFVRVDCYYVDETVYIGEITFYHGGGMERFYPQRWNKRLGDKIVLKVKK